MNNTTISEVFMQSLKNAYGSKHNFERELIYKAYQFGNKGKMFFSLSPYLNFTMYPEETKEKYNTATWTDVVETWYKDYTYNFDETNNTITLTQFNNNNKN